MEVRKCANVCVLASVQCVCLRHRKHSNGNNTVASCHVTYLLSLLQPRYTREAYLDLVGNIRSIVPGGFSYRTECTR